MDGKDTGRARLVGEINHLPASVDEGLEAVVAKPNVALCLVERSRCWAADRHAETLKKKKSKPS
jgi:hypothetical protein